MCILFAALLVKGSYPSRGFFYFFVNEKLILNVYIGERGYN